MSVWFNDTGGIAVHSFANDDPIACKDYVRQKAGLPAWQPRRTVSTSRPWRRDDADIERAVLAAANGQQMRPSKIVAEYGYTDTGGDLLYQVVRLDNPKSFRQRRPNDSGGWTWKKGGQRVLYRLPELKKFPDATVFVTEGEKDADRVAGLNLCATTVATGDWSDVSIEALRGRDVIILEDNDDAGRKKALAAAEVLNGTARTIRIVRFTDLPERGDVSDWLDADTSRGAHELGTYCFQFPLWDGRVPPDADASVITDTGSPYTAPQSWWRDPTDIPKRDFLFGKHYARKNIGATIGAGGRSKTTLGLYEAVSMAAGIQLTTGEALPTGALRVWALNGEEDQDELDRRLAAICQHYNITEADLGGRLFAQSVRDKPLRIASLQGHTPILN